MTTIVDLTPAARRLSELVQHIDDDQLGAPTRGGIPVASMLDHVGGLAVAFVAAAAKDLGAVTATPSAPDGDRLGSAWRTRIPRALTALAQAWTDPAAWEGMTQVGGVTLTGEIADRSRSTRSSCTPGTSPAAPASPTSRIRPRWRPAWPP